MCQTLQRIQPSTLLAVIITTVISVTSCMTKYTGHQPYPNRIQHELLAIFHIQLTAVRSSDVSTAKKCATASAQWPQQLNHLLQQMNKMRYCTPHHLTSKCFEGQIYSCMKPASKKVHDELSSDNPLCHNIALNNQIADPVTPCAYLLWLGFTPHRHGAPNAVTHQYHVIDAMHLAFL